MYEGDCLDHGLTRSGLATYAPVLTEAEKLAGDTALIWVGIGFAFTLFVAIPFLFG